MAESDDEYNDGRRRDNKFGRERNDYSSNRNNLGGWPSNDNNNWSSSHHRSGGGNHQPNHHQRNDSYGRRENRYTQQQYPNYNSSSNYEPSAKRNRLNLNHWGDDRNDRSHSNYESNYDNSYNTNINSNDNNLLTQPSYLSFKQFMRNLDDSIDHLEAAKRYNEYKFEFKRKQITEFFNAHKDEEWLRIKYHPIESSKRKKELKSYVKHRAKVFFDLYKQGLVESTTIDIEKSDQITNVLDSIVIKLEGGTDFDLKCLDTHDTIKDIETPTTEINVDNNLDENETNAEEQKKDMDESKNDEIDVVKNEKIKEESNTEDEKMVAEESIKQEKENFEKTTKKESTINDETNFSIKYENTIKDENVVQEKDLKMEDDKEILDQSIKNENKGELTLNKEADEFLKQNLKNENITIKDEKFDANQNIIEDFKGQIEEKMNCEEAKAENELNKEAEDLDKPRPLHKTLSIFLRYLPANVTKEEIEIMFKEYPGFLRVALSDPTFDKRFQRRGWVTFDRNVDIKKIYLNLKDVKIRDCEFGAIINRDLSRRIRSVNGIASHRLNVLADLKHTTKIILNLDDEKGVWDQLKSDEEDNILFEHKFEGLPEKITVFGQETRNPLLVGVEECINKSTTPNETVNEETGEISEEEPINEKEPKLLERDENLIKVLDKLVFYLRVVHSLDYYNHIDYPNEDEMPNRIGIMHARGMAPTANITLKEVNDYIRSFENKISPYLERVLPLSDEEVVKLGKRKIDEEIEKFISENTKEIKSDKWLCPLSGKKFKGPEFVKKHIETKHEDKLENVKHETEYFNLYLTDPRRPQLAEHPFNRPGYNKQQQQSSSINDNQHLSLSSNSHSNYGGNNIHQRINFNQAGNYNGNRYNQSGYNQGYNQSGYNNNNYNNFRNSGNRSGYNNRKRIYRDLDAPADY